MVRTTLTPEAVLHAVFRVTKVAGLALALLVTGRCAWRDYLLVLSAPTAQPTICLPISVGKVASRFTRATYPSTMVFITVFADIMAGRALFTAEVETLRFIFIFHTIGHNGCHGHLQSERGDGCY